MTKEEKTELKQLRKRLATIQRGEMREAAQILAEERKSDRSYERLLGALETQRKRDTKRIAREFRRACSGALKAARERMKEIKAQRKALDRAHAETRAVQDRIAVLEGRLS